MKLVIFCFVIITMLLNFSCRQNVESSPAAPNEKLVETPQTNSTPDKYKEFDVSEQSSTNGNENQPISLNYKGYKIEKISVKKKDVYDNPEADIYDAVISKNGKTITRFEGLYNPMGNEISLYLYQFLSGSEKQLLIFDDSYRHDHAWVISLSPKFEVIFDAADYDVLYGGFTVMDPNNDGEKEIALRTFSNVGFEFSNVDQPSVQIIFKYDVKTRKYLPASHLFAELTLREQAERLQKFNKSEEKKLPEVMQIVLTDIYAGNENEAWRFFDENLPARFMHYGLERNREQIKARILASLNKEPIYKFIRNDLKRMK